MHFESIYEFDKEMNQKAMKMNTNANSDKKLTNRAYNILLIFIINK
jgi:hypothetical protein